MEVGWVGFLEAEPEKGFYAGGVWERSEDSRIEQGKYAKQGRGSAGD